MEADHGTLPGMGVIRMNCKECCHNGYKAMCDACKHMQKEGRWKWEIDNGNRVIRCPDCGGGMIFGAYRYTNPFMFCPYCGHQMITHKQMELDVDAMKYGEVIME